MKKVVVVGHLDWRGNSMIGAVVKARNIYDELKNQLGDKQVDNVDIYNWKSRKGQVIQALLGAFARSKNIVIVCSDTSKPLMQAFSVLKKIFHNKILYCVVGGDIAELLAQNSEQIATLSCIDTFFVETLDCVESLKKLGIRNVELLRNFKCIKPLNQKDIKQRKNEELLAFCTFSRVIEQKGIGDAVRAISAVNQEYECRICKIDIYGPIDETYEDEFKKLIKNYDCATYCGVIESNKSVETLKRYYCLLFPTKYQTEGIPGTIVDGFAAGLPVICSDWVRCRQIVTDGVNGIVYPFGDEKQLKEKIKFSIEHPDYVERLRTGALNEFEFYRPEIAIQPLLKEICN